MNPTSSQPERPEDIIPALTPLTGTWRTRCCVCGIEYENGCGSTECCGSPQEIIEKDGKPYPATRTPAPEAEQFQKGGDEPCAQIVNAEIRLVAHSPTATVSSADFRASNAPAAVLSGSQGQAPEAVAGEVICNTCVDNSGYIPIVHGLSNDGHGDIPCPDCNTPTPPVEADKDAETGDGMKIRVERCGKCNCFVSDWVEAEEFNGRICRPCESLTAAESRIAEVQKVLEKVSATLLMIQSSKKLDLYLLRPDINESVRLVNTALDKVKNGSWKADADLTTARATIAERDKRIAELVGALNDACLHLSPVVRMHESERRRNERDFSGGMPTGPCTCLVCTRHRFYTESLAHAAEGKEQA